MNEISNLKILLCTDSTQAAIPVANLLNLLELPKDSMITMLGLGPQGETSPGLVESLSRLEELLSPQYQLNTIIKTGKPYTVILKEVETEQYDIVALGDPKFMYGERPSPPFINSRRLAQRLTKKLGRPLLVGRGDNQSLDRVLICSSGEKPAMNTLKECARWLSKKPLKVHLLHVMSQIALESAAESGPLFDTAESAIARGSREGKHLQESIDKLLQSGFQGEITPRLRHGLVIDEVLKEIREYMIDLLVIGSHRREGDNPLLGMLLQDIASELVNEASCSVLIL